MELSANDRIQLKTIDRENAALLFPLFKADLKEISRWFPFDEDYKLEYDLSYVEEKVPPFDETFVIYYNGLPCGRVGLYDYDPSKGEIYLYYWVASPFRRKHIALDSVLIVMEHLKSLGIKGVLFDTKKANKSSIALIDHLPVPFCWQRGILFGYTNVRFNSRTGFVLNGVHCMKTVSHVIQKKETVMKDKENAFPLFGVP